MYAPFSTVNLSNTCTMSYNIRINDECKYKILFRVLICGVLSLTFMIKQPTNILKIRILSEAKSRKYQGVFKVKSRVKTWQVQGIWSQQLEYKQVPKRGTEPCARRGKRSLLACHTRCKCSMETTHNSMKVKFGIKVIKTETSILCLIRHASVIQSAVLHL